MFYNNRKPYSNSISERNKKIQEIYKDEMNDECFDCGKKSPEFISANNGIFICEDCMKIHYQFTDEVSLIIRNNLFLLNEEQINYIYYGGNRKLLEFINYEFPQLQNYQPEILYKTQAMQYYRDKLYYFAEGGVQPLKPDDQIAYKLISNIYNFPMTERRDKIESNKKNKNNFYYYMNMNMNDEEEEEDEDEDEDENENENNLNEENDNNYDDYNDENYNDYDYNNDNRTDNDDYKLRKNKKILDGPNYPSNNSSFVYHKHKMNKNNSFVLTRRFDRSLTNFRNNKIRIREPENINIVSNNSRSNFYKKTDNFFIEMNRLFGKADDQRIDFAQTNYNRNHSKIIYNPHINKQNNYFYQMQINNNNNNLNYFNKMKEIHKTYQVQRPKASYNYNNFIKNTININNNNTNIFLDEENNKKVLSKSQFMNAENDNNNNNFTFGPNNNILNNINNHQNSKSLKYGRPFFKNNNKKKININIKKKKYIKPSYINENNITSFSDYNNYNSLPFFNISRTKVIHHKKSNSDLKENDNNYDNNEPLKNEKMFYKTLSPTSFAPVESSQSGEQSNVFVKKKINYIKKKKITKNDNYEFGDEGVIPIQNNELNNKVLIIDSLYSDNKDEFKIENNETNEDFKLTNTLEENEGKNIEKKNIKDNENITKNQFQFHDKDGKMEINNIEQLGMNYISSNNNIDNKNKIINNENEEINEVENEEELNEIEGQKLEIVTNKIDEDNNNNINIKNNEANNIEDNNENKNLIVNENTNEIKKEFIEEDDEKNNLMLTIIINL